MRDSFTVGKSLHRDSPTLSAGGGGGGGGGLYPVAR